MSKNKRQTLAYRMQPAIPAGLFFWLKSWSQLRRLRKKLIRGKEVRRHTTVSRDIYENYGPWEQEMYLHGQEYTTCDGKIRLVPFTRIRAGYLAPVKTEIERQLAAAPGQRLRVLEVGAGNCINLMLLNEAFGDKIELVGIDISPKRLEVSRETWGAKLDGVDLHVDSATELATCADRSFDVVFSMHCLEQVPYDAGSAVRAISRVCRGRIVFVEPVFEFGNTAQKIYAITGDQLRTLLPEIAKAGLRVVESYPLDILAHPLNKTGVVVVEV
ncbi:MAG: methyltransferase domain-containing protein [Rhodobacteraceae bacterium]|nr:methyltransferase domain-containing protein [Paracoccaceae bacterium]